MSCDDGRREQQGKIMTRERTDMDLKRLAPSKNDDRKELSAYLCTFESVA